MRWCSEAQAAEQVKLAFEKRHFEPHLKKKKKHHVDDQAHR